MAIPISRKVMYTTATTLVFLGFLEVGLALWAQAHLTERPPMVRLPVGASGVVFCVGDSVTAGVGVPPGQAWPDHLGLSLLRDGVTLQREALPGAGLEFARGQPLERLLALPQGAAPTVLVMLGHNDLVRWEPGVRSHFNRLRNAPTGPRNRAAGGEAARWKGLRLLRAVRWGWLVLSGAAPRVDQAGVASLSERMVAAYRGLQEAAVARGGRLVLLTYLVPGRPPATLEEAPAVVVAASREAQLQVNRSIRTAGQSLGAEVIDLASAIELGEMWSLDHFVDHIHPTPRSSAQMGAVIYSRVRPN